MNNVSYFALLGTFTDICREELLLIEPKNLVIKQGVAFFDSYVGEIEKLSGIIKRGEVATKDTLYKFFANILLLGSNSEELAKFIKGSGRVRRWKLLKDFRSSDVELKKEGGREVLEIDGKYCVVQGYQDIEHYEKIDFGKPSSGMEIGMMPSKLAQILVNIGIHEIRDQRLEIVENSDLGSHNSCLTFFDPFCGFGTTGFVANWLGHHFIGSDINITPCKENVKRWKEGIGQKFDKYFTVFRHDVLESFNSKKMLDSVDVIVTEGWLGPIMRNFQGREKRKPEVMEKVLTVYAGFLKNYSKRFYAKKAPLVMTIPVYQFDGSSIEQDLILLCEGLGLTFRSIEQVYVRKGQNVGRKICIITFVS